MFWLPKILSASRKTLNLSSCLACYVALLSLAQNYPALSCPAIFVTRGYPVSYLWVCIEVLDVDSNVTTDLLATFSSRDEYTSKAFNTFRDAAAFDWKNLIIV